MKPRGGVPWRTIAEPAVLFAAFTAIFYALLVRREALMDPDALYHYKVSALILSQGPWVDVSWLPFTVLGDRGTDHHWFFHVLVAPLTLHGSSFEAVSFAAAAVGAMVPTALLVMLRRALVPWALLFAVAAVIASDLLPARMLMLRTQNLAIVLMVASLFALVTRRALLAGVLAFIFMQSYHGAVILGGLAAAALGALWIVERRIDLKPLAAVCVGVGLGLIASPWFPENIGYLVFHTFFKAAAGMPHLVGTEWYRVPLSLLVTESLPAHLILLSGVAAVVASRNEPGWPRVGVDTLAFLACTALFLAMYHFAWRFVEYYVPFAMVTAALLWRDAARSSPPQGARRALLPAMLAVLIAWGAIHGANRMDDGMRHRFTSYAAMMRYVDEHDPAPMVFNSHWPDFVKLFFRSHKARYVAGLDGHYLLYGKDPAKFRAWDAIATGSTAHRTDNAKVIREVFDAGWAVIPRGHRTIAAALARDPGAVLVMENEDGWLFRIAPRP